MPLRWGIAPMKAVSSETVPTDDGWEFEIKWDGNRNFAFVEDGAVRFQTSNKLDSTARFAALSSLPDGVNAKQAILDGEVVILDPAGRPSFSLLQQGEGALLYVIFDVLQIDGRDVTGLAYSGRRKLLEQLVDNGDRWMVSPRHADGNALYEAAKERGLEGVMAKRVDSVYEPGRRSPAWRKIKYRPQQEFVVGGWVPGGGTRGSTFAALLVGVYKGKKLQYSGRVGTGFKERELQRLLGRFRELASDECPFDPPPPPPTRKIAHWLRPEMVVEVQFAEWTGDNILRQPAYMGERDDKNPRKVVREI
jgi:bifunctional non-homologous end joining protein LigD